MTFIVLLVIVALIGFWAMRTYNRLVALRNRYKNAFAQIDVQLTAALRPDPQPGRDRQGLHASTSARRSRR